MHGHLKCKCFDRLKKSLFYKNSGSGNLHFIRIQKFCGGIMLCCRQSVDNGINTMTDPSEF